jgi:hypothetical protein
MLFTPAPQQKSDSLAGVCTKLPTAINHTFTSRTQRATTHHKNSHVFLRQSRLSHKQIQELSFTAQQARTRMVAAMILQALSQATSQSSSTSKAQHCNLQTLTPPAQPLITAIMNESLAQSHLTTHLLHIARLSFHRSTALVPPIVHKPAPTGRIALTRPPLPAAQHTTLLNSALLAQNATTTTTLANLSQRHKDALRQLHRTSPFARATMATTANHSRALTFGTSCQQHPATVHSDLAKNGLNNEHIPT